MAIFASTTTSGYSDPMKAMTIKALEKRQADMLAAQLKGGEITPENTQTPIQGVGHLFNQLGDQMREGRVEAAAAARRQELANVMSQFGPEGPTTQQLAQVHSADPELGMKLAQQAFEARQSKAQQTFQSGESTLTREQQSKESGLTRQQQAELAANSDKRAREMQQEQLAAAEATAARSDERARTLQAEKLAAEAAKPQTELEKLTQSLGRKPTEEEVKASIEKLTAPSTSEMKAGNELQNSYLNTQSTLNDLKEARDLLGPEGTGIRAGAGGGLTQTGAKWGGDALGLSDPKLTKNTERFNQIMSAEAITTMAQTLKGASTDFELKQFVALMNDPNAEPATKVKALNNMIAKAEAHTALQLDQMKRAKVAPPAGPATGPAAAAPADPNAAARKWLEANPNDPDAPAVRAKLGIK